MSVRLGIGPGGKLAATGTLVAGKWALIDGLYPLVLSVGGEFTGTVKLYATQQPTRPTDGDTNQGQLGVDITAPTLLIYDAPFKWVMHTEDLDTGSATVAVMTGEKR